MTNTNEPRGTFACPICGQDTPHHHADAQVAAYRDDQVRRDGWISTASRLPSDPIGDFYLIRGHRIEVPKDDYYNVSYNAYQRRMEGPGYPAEVAQWDNGYRAFMLLHWSGNARTDGKDGRHAVYVRPSQWRPIPAFGEPSDADSLIAKISGLEAVVADQRRRLQSLQTDAGYERERLVRELGEACAAIERAGQGAATTQGD